VSQVSPAGKQRTRLHRVHLARLVRRERMMSTVLHCAQLLTETSSTRTQTLSNPRFCFPHSTRPRHLIGSAGIATSGDGAPAAHRCIAAHSFLWSVQSSFWQVYAPQLSTTNRHNIARESGERTALQYHIFLHCVQRLRPVAGAGEMQDEQKCSKFLVERT
jgi:hypothetical protein